MRTITVQIGNSDDKLTQESWSWFVKAIAAEIELYSTAIHFSGASHPWASWQNTAWVFSVEESNIERLQQRVVQIRETWKQDSVAWTEGETAFI